MSKRQFKLLMDKGNYVPWPADKPKPFSCKETGFVGTYDQCVKYAALKDMEGMLGGGGLLSGALKDTPKK